MKKISAACILLLGVGGLLWSQSEGSSFIEMENPDFSAASVNIAPITANSFRQEGVASWYGAEFAGRMTASGEIFDPAQLTAAHAELPFGTYLIVTNTGNGKKIAVRVNDRGPFVHSRILDVSRSAAERLDMLAAGTAKVVIEATTREGAQSLVRELGVSTSVAARTAPAATQPPAASSMPVPVAASRATTPAPSGNAAPASAATQPPAASSTAVPAAASRATTPAPSGSTVPAASPTASAAASRIAAPSGNAATAAAASQTPATDPSATAGTPVMSPTSPRVPTQSAITPTLVPSPSVSRVTGQVENIPDIRRSSDPNYVVMDEQVVPALPPPNIPPASAPPTTPEVASAVPATPVPQTAAPPQSNPAASVPVTNPQFTDKIEFTGSQMIRGKNYRIQVGSFTDLKNASEVFLRLFDADLNPSYESYEHYGDKYYRVVITNVKAEDADALSRKLAEIGITEALAREDAVRE